MSRRLADVTSEAHDLLQTALALPADDRAELAAVLLESLESDPDDEEHVFSEAWRTEIEARARRVLNGDSPGTPWEDVRDQLAARLRAR